jgi:FkbM family methyltransferase
VIHCGAHFGEEAPFYAARNFSVLWVEASRACEPALQRQLAQYPGQTYRMAALSAHSGERRLFHLSNNGAGMSSSFHQFGPAAEQLWPELQLHHVESVAATTTTLDQLLEIESIWVSENRPTALVLDVQGAELEVLTGAAGSLWRFDWILCEVSSAAVYSVGATQKQVQQILESHGFILEGYFELRPGHGDVLYKRQPREMLDQDASKLTGVNNINIARINHLDSLPLDLKERSVLELGSGRGDLSDYFLAQGCALTSVEGRADLVSVAAARHEARSHSRWSGFCYDMTKTLSPGACRYNVISAYGILNDLPDPIAFLDRVAAMKPELFLLESCVMSEYQSVDPSFVEQDDVNAGSQVVSEAGCPPSREWLWTALQARFAFVYACRSQPDHPDFPLDWSRGASAETNTRMVFIGAERQLNCSYELVSLLPQTQYRGAANMNKPRVKSKSEADSWRRNLSAF